MNTTTEDNNVYLETGYSWANGWYALEDIFDACGAAFHIAESLELTDDQEKLIRDADILVIDTSGPIATAFQGSYGCFDWEGAELALEYANTSREPQVAIKVFVDHEGSWDADRFEDAYCGDWSGNLNEPMKEYAMETFEDCNDIPDHLSHYIDWDAVTRDFAIDHYEEDGHVFRSC